jgi:hypothetical protein
MAFMFFCSFAASCSRAAALIRALDAALLATAWMAVTLRVAARAIEAIEC